MFILGLSAVCLSVVHSIWVPNGFRISKIPVQENMETSDQACEAILGTAWEGNKSNVDSCWAEKKRSLTNFKQAIMATFKCCDKRRFDIPSGEYPKFGWFHMQCWPGTVISIQRRTARPGENTDVAEYRQIAVCVPGSKSAPKGAPVKDDGLAGSGKTTSEKQMVGSEELPDAEEHTHDEPSGPGADGAKLASAHGSERFSHHSSGRWKKGEEDENDSHDGDRSGKLCCTESMWTTVCESSDSYSLHF